MAEPMSAERLTEIKAHNARDVQAYDAVGLSEAEADRFDLVAEVDRLRERDARIHEELRDRRTDDLNVRGHLSPQPGTGPEPCIPFELGPTIAPAVEWLVVELDRLRAAVPSWADLRDLLVAQRYTAATEVEITNAVMALITGANHG